MEKTIEQKVAGAILEKSAAEIKIGGRTYNIAPPSIATLILVSEIVSTLPVVRKSDAGPAEIVASVLHHAKDFRKLGEIAAVLILGAKGLEDARAKRKSRLLRMLGAGRKAARAERLAKEINESLRPSELWELVLQRLNAQEIGDFFLITTSLSEANILKPTREVD